ncbi:MAG TPA: hypothetical protein VGN49_03515, partial [Micrococcaceae bacterium]|nr:hypothetical protein [Micrococcaceae bacterium]
YGDRPAREGEFGSQERKPYGDGAPRNGRQYGAGQSRGERPYNERPAGDRDRKPYGERAPRAGRPYGDRPARTERPYNDRPASEGERRTFGDRNRQPYGDRPSTGDRAPRGDRPYNDRRASDRESRPFGDRERKPYGDRAPRGDRPFNDRAAGDRERKPFGDRERKPYGDRAPRSDRPYGNGPARDGERKPFNDRAPRADRPYGARPDREDRPAPVHNAADLRSSNRPDRERSPQIDEDVTGSELDKVTRAQLRTLEPKSGEWVSKHLVMAGRLLDEDAELAFQHALAASRRGGRLAAVREAVGLTAYAAGHYGEALREFRTYRRISGSNEHLPVMADCERGLGRPDRALDIARSEDVQALDTAGKVEMAIVSSGARADLGETDAAVAALEIPQLDMNRAFSYSPRLFRAYSDALRAAGRTEEAQTWQRQAAVAETALGIGEDADPFIFDLAEEDEEQPRRKERSSAGFDENGEALPEEPKQERQASRSATAASAAALGTAEVDDAEPDFFDSDDAESDEFSADDDVQSGDDADPDAVPGVDDADPDAVPGVEDDAVPAVDDDPGTGIRDEGHPLDD